MALQIPGNPGSPLRVMAIHLKLFHHKLFDDRFGIWTSAMAGEGRVKRAQSWASLHPSRQISLEQRFSHLCMYPNHPEGWLNQIAGSRPRRSRVGSKKRQF